MSFVDNTYGFDFNGSTYIKSNETAIEFNGHDSAIYFEFKKQDEANNASYLYAMGGVSSIPLANIQENRKLIITNPYRIEDLEDYMDDLVNDEIYRVLVNTTYNNVDTVTNDYYVNGNLIYSIGVLSSPIVNYYPAIGNTSHFGSNSSANSAFNTNSILANFTLYGEALTEQECTNITSGDFDNTDSRIDYYRSFSNTVGDSTVTGTEQYAIIEDNTVYVSTPILYTVNNRKIYPHKTLTINGVNLSGNIAIKIGNNNIFVSGNKSDTEVSIVVPESLELGKLSLNVVKFQIIEDVVEYSDIESNTMYLNSYENIQSAVQNFIPEYNETSYTDRIIKLLPKGIFAVNEDSNIYKLIKVIASECVNINDNVKLLNNESDPLKTDQFLSLWENEYGLPETCVTTGVNRKQELIRKYLAFGGNSPAYFEYIAGLVGLTIRVRDEEKSIMMNCEDNCESAVIAQEMNFVWYIDVFGVIKHIMNCEDNCESPLAWFEGGTIECFFNKIKPAHTIIHFNYELNYTLVTNTGANIITDDDKTITANL